MTASWVLAIGVYAFMGWLFVGAEDQRKFNNKMIENGTMNKYEITVK